MRPTFLLHIISAIMTFFQEALLLKGDPAMRSQAPAGADECAAIDGCVWADDPRNGGACVPLVARLSLARSL